MRIAFKEWAVVVDTLGRGEQIIIFRKGGIAEGKGGFKPEHQRFWLMPTLFHQQRESVVADARRRFDELLAAGLPDDRVKLEFCAEVALWRPLESLDMAQKLRGQHIWSDEVIAGRFNWGREKRIYVMAVRVSRLPQPVELPMLPEYGGCKSWVELAKDMDDSPAQPVLGEETFAEKLENLKRALDG